MAETFKSFYIDHVPLQQNTHADALALLRWPFQPEPRRKYSSTATTCTAFEESQTTKRDLQVKKVLETSIGPKLKSWQFPFIEFVLYGILPDDPKEEPAIKRTDPRFYYNVITRKLYH